MAGLRGEALLDGLRDGVMLLVAEECIVVCSIFQFVYIGVQFALLLECAGLVEALCSIGLSCAHLAFFMPLTQKGYCCFVLRMLRDAIWTKYADSAIKANATAC